MSGDLTIVGNVSLGDTIHYVASGSLDFGGAASLTDGDGLSGSATVSATMIDNAGVSPSTSRGQLILNAPYTQAEAVAQVPTGRS